ncbi:MAG: ATP-binding cassette domain-containing protein [Syntrophomonadaceae bacterium]|nr:ATP-binding cassette domain-containing protein [Syntrophomonadaceae bacterium]
MIEKISVLSGQDKEGKAEGYQQIDIYAGEIVAVVGATGSGKTRLISDIEQYAFGETPTKRKILINNLSASEYYELNNQRQFVGQVTQNMNFVMDVKVGDFLTMHAESRGMYNARSIIKKVLEAANNLAGEPFDEEDDLTSLSGGQSRALMIADVALISDVGIVLMDEIENAGIDRIKAFNLLTSKGKISITSTHDPLMALMANRRIVMSGGGIKSVLWTNETERSWLSQMLLYDKKLQKLRDIIRKGGQIP